MATALTEAKIKKVRKRLHRGETEGKILSAEKISLAQLENIRDNFNPEATPETLSKLKRDPLKNLESRGALDECDLMAADMIRAAIQIRTAGLGSKCASIETRIDQVGKKRGEDETMWSIRVQEQYSAWLMLCAVERPRIQTIPVTELLTDLVGLKDLDQAYGKENGWTRDHVVRGLKLYCENFRLG
tara:strand:- start:1562 stop:2122 length:561 start_codon:yes stop_codon:yes gene_type:complete